jgi:prevent-host-death family protein
MNEIDAFEAKNALGTLLDRVERGEEIVITRHGKPVARLVPNTGRSDATQARAASERIRSRAQRPISPGEKWALVELEMDTCLDNAYGASTVRVAATWDEPVYPL